MKTKNTMTRAFTATALSFCLLTAAAQPIKCVTLQGTVHVAEGHPGNASVVMTLNGQTAEAIPVNRKGNFKIYVPEGRTADLTFSMEGHAAKLIHIDTEDAFSSSAVGKNNKRVEFDVVLRPFQDIPEDLITSAGSIRFIPGSGDPQVSYEATSLNGIQAELIAVSGNRVQNW